MLRPSRPVAGAGGDDTKALEDRIKVLVRATQFDETRAAAVAELTGLEARFRTELEQSNLKPRTPSDS
jgi:hypothetical protein